MSLGFLVAFAVLIIIIVMGLGHQNDNDKNNVISGPTSPTSLPSQPVSVSLPDGSSLLESPSLPDGSSLPESSESFSASSSAGASASTPGPSSQDTHRPASAAPPAASSQQPSPPAADSTAPSSETPTPPPSSSAASSSAAPPRSSSTPQPVRVNINTATEAELLTVPGMMPMRAKYIVRYREEYGLYQSVDDLLHVPGIGVAALNDLRPYLYV